MTSRLFALSGKVALVTGSTRGIGKSIAEELARAGARSMDTFRADRVYSRHARKP